MLDSLGMRTSLILTILVLALSSSLLGDESKSFSFDGTRDHAFNAALLAVRANWSLRHANVHSGTIWFTRTGGRDRIDFDIGAVFEPGTDGHTNVTVVLVPAKKNPTQRDADTFALEFQRAMETFRGAPLTDMVKDQGNQENDDAYETVTRAHPLAEVFEAAKIVADRRFEVLSADAQAHTLIFKRVATPTVEHPGSSEPLICIVNFVDQWHDDWRLRMKFRREDSGRVFLSSDTEGVAHDFFQHVQDLLKLGVEPGTTKPASGAATCHFAPC